MLGGYAMRIVRTLISVSGFSESEARSGLPDLIAELRQRPWIICPDADWDARRSRLVVTTHYEDTDPELSSRGAMDEVQDCVIACLSFASEGIHFDVDESILLPAA